MSALEFYALFGAPLLMFLTGLGAYYIALRGARQDRSPAE
jgi:hypothetical protein